MTSITQIALTETYHATKSTPYTDERDLEDFAVAFHALFIQHLAINLPHAWMGVRWTVNQCASVARKQALEIVGKPVVRAPTLQQEIAFELAETMSRCADSLLPKDRPTKSMLFLEDK